MLTDAESKRFIQEQLQALEREHDVKILYASEAGSRAWGFESKDSDYDVRFIYIRPMHTYLKIDKIRDVIEKPGPVFDIAGWDILKTFHLFRKGNPPLIEWLNSPIVYHKELNQELAVDEILRDLIPHFFDAKSQIYHYLHMAHRNWKEYLQGQTVWTKKYFYVLRPMLACSWVEMYNNPSPVQFDELWLNKEKLTDGRYSLEFHDALTEAIVRLIKRKREGDELSSGPSVPVLHQFLESEIQYFTNKVKGYENPPKENYDRLTDILDKLFRKCLMIIARLI